MCWTLNKLMVHPIFCTLILFNSFENIAQTCRPEVPYCIRRNFGCDQIWKNCVTVSIVLFYVYMLYLNVLLYWFYFLNFLCKYFSMSFEKKLSKWHKLLTYIFYLLSPSKLCIIHVLHYWYCERSVNKCLIVWFHILNRLTSYKHNC